MLDQQSQWYKIQYPDCFITEEQRMMQKVFADFVDNEIMPVRTEIDDDETHEKIINPLLKKLQVDIGCQRNMIPKEFGGNEELSLIVGALRQEQIARGDYGISMHTAVTDWAWAPATAAYLSPKYSKEAKAWGEAVLQEFAPRFVGDELASGCFNMSEAQSACDIENPTNEGRTIRTRAELKGNEWVINGAKEWASNAGIADLNVVMCNMDPGSGIDKFALIYVPEPWPGVSHGKFEKKCGLQADRNCSTYFDNVRVPKEWGIAGPEAWELFVESMVTAIPLNVFNALGLLQGAFDVLLEYTGQRVVGGKPIREHLSTAVFLGEMAAAISVIRSAGLLTIHQFDNRQIYGEWTSNAMVAKARSILTHTTKTAQQLIAKGMEFMGSYGYVRDYQYEKYYREIAISRIVLGGTQVGLFQICKQFYDLDFSAFGPGKLEKKK